MDLKGIRESKNSHELTDSFKRSQLNFLLNTFYGDRNAYLQPYTQGYPRLRLRDDGTVVKDPWLEPNTPSPSFEDQYTGRKGYDGNLRDILFNIVRQLRSSTKND